MQKTTITAVCLLLGLLALGVGAQQGGFRPVPLQSKVANVQPMTGIMYWENRETHNTDSIVLEYFNLRYNDVVKRKGEYDWSSVEKRLADVASRKHQAVVRPYDTTPGQPSSAVPDYIKAMPGYKDLVTKSENRDTGFPDWSSAEYQRFFLEFYEKFAQKFDGDPRLAFLEVGFGLWSEYHVYSGPEILGETFPSREFQGKFFRHLAKTLKQTPWLISQDAHEAKRTPFIEQKDLLKLDFGIFDDTFHLAWKPSENLRGWEFFGRDRYKRSPCGGEIATFRNKEFEQMVASNWAAETRNFGMTFMLAEGWGRATTADKIKEHSMACGYHFKVTAFEAGPKESRVTVTNAGVAPIYYDAYPAVNGVRAKESLKFLQAGESRRFTVASGGAKPALTIECDRLVPGQRIEYDADLQ
jgi:hypothetical protein